MDSQIIVYILIAFAIGCVIAWLIARLMGNSAGLQFAIGCAIAWLIAPFKGNSASDRKELQKLRLDKDKLEGQLNALKEENSQLQSEVINKEKVMANRIAETEETLKAWYDQLVQRINEENKRLDLALKLATEGKVDESVKAQLAEAEKSAARIVELDNELMALRQKHDSLLKENEPLRQDLEVAKSECSKLLKKVKNLEDEIEEAEEEQEALEKKLKAKGNELQEVTEQLEKSGKENKQLHTELEQREEELASRLEELKRKCNSIEFIQEILSAPETGAKDVKDMYRAIDAFGAFLRGNFMDCNLHLYDKYALAFNEISGKAGFEEKKRYFLQLFEQWASVKRKSWLDKKTTIAFVGEFSAGKTSIVNRILSQDDPNVPLLPVSAKATTAIPTYIAGGVAETYNFVTPDDKLKSINKDIFKRVSKEVLDEVKGVSSLIKYFVMTYKNPNLNGLSVLDTPGFNSNDAEDKARTIDVINECDALFWVFDVNAGTVNRSSIALIREKLNKPLIVVINKVDTKPKSEVDKVETLIHKTLTAEGLSVEKFIRFSAKASLADIMKPIHGIRHDEARDEFVNWVGQDLNQLMNILDNWVKEADKKYQDCYAEAGRITDKFNECMVELCRYCEEAAGIPHWETHMFSSDRYEMNRSEGGRLINLLDDIANAKTGALAEIYNEEMSAVAEMQQAYSYLCDLKASWQKTNDCLTEYKRSIKQLR